MTRIEVTKEFLEEGLKTKWGSMVGLGVKIDKFTLAKGSIVGDGYTTMLLTVDVWLKGPNLKDHLTNWYSMKRGEIWDTENQKPDLSLVIKCYPENPARQKFLENREFFMTELSVYEKITPVIQDELDIDGKFKLPFPLFIGGQALTPQQMKDLKLTRPLKPLDNYIMMIDVRKHGGFRLRDRFLGFDLDHYRLVIETQAYLHALSWAFKCRKGGMTLTSAFPALNHKTMADNWSRIKPMMNKTVAMVRQLLAQEPHYFEGGDTAQILGGLDDLERNDKIGQIYALYFDRPWPKNGVVYTKDTILRVPADPQIKDEVPWSVLLQGDTWSNNMMFRYDEVSGKPVQKIFLDLQVAREGDPMVDIVYALYTGTTRQFRAKHLESMLHLYFDKFSQICEDLQVPLLPGFTWPEFKRRFHRAKIFGLAIGLMTLPADLKKPDYLVDLDEYKSGGPVETKNESSSDNFMEMLNPHQHDLNQYHPAMKERVAGILIELTGSGVI